MACFLVPAAEAVITTIVTKVVKTGEDAAEAQKKTTDGVIIENSGKIPFSRKLKWLNNMLWGGSALLAFEHIWHGEVVPWFPFLTAAENSADAAQMLHEMATTGVMMAALVTLVWLGMVAVSSAMEKKKSGAITAEEQEA